GVGEHGPGDLWTLADVDPARTQREQPRELVLGAHPVRAQVEVQPGLPWPRLRRRGDVYARSAPVGGADAPHRVVLHLEDHPVEDGAPEFAEQLRMLRLDGHLGDATRHGRSVVLLRTHHPGVTLRSGAHLSWAASGRMSIRDP